MTDSTAKVKTYSLVGVIFTVAFSLAALALSYWTQIHTGELLFFVSLNTAFFSILLFNENRLVYRAELEAHEQSQVQKSTGASKELFDESDEAMLLAARSLKTWRTYLLPGLTLVYGLGAIVFLVMKWQVWGQHLKVEMENSMAAAACAGALGVSYFLMGAFYGGASKNKEAIKLRPISSWAYFSSIVCIALVGVLFFGGEKYTDADHYSNRIILGLLIFLAFEVSVNFLIDWYRPRFHEAEKSILESRLLAVFTDSGSIASNIAHALDYQFGLKVTEEGFYKFFGKKLLPLLALQLLTLYLLSCFTLIETGERGVRETLGTIDSKSELNPGLYVKLPWPFSTIHVYPADKIQTIEVGQHPKRDQGPEEPPMDEGEAKVTVTEDVSLWSKAGHHEEGMEDINFIISTSSEKQDKTALAQVNMITVIVPVQYKIKKHVAGEDSPLYKFMFNHANSKAVLRTIVSEVVMKYLSQADYYQFLGKDRENAAANLQALAQAEVDKLDLGVEIVELALETTHPPESVSKSYDDVIAATFDKDVTVFEAGVTKEKVLSEARIKKATLSLKPKVKLV
ncbi:MAG: SPFH domain-containing protein [Lentisphaeraceae bacterium]|nr:SPFH domain-containing protein [Lentisphaeraceae bacterium]